MVSTRKNIADMFPGDEIHGVYMLKSAEEKTASTGKAYLALEIQDRTGTIPCKMWNFVPPFNIVCGGPVMIRGAVQSYKGENQMVISGIRVTTDTDVFNMEDLIPASPLDCESMLAQVEKMLNQIKDEDYRKICLTFLNEDRETFKTIPAAQKVHHAYLHGLLTHTMTMMKTADFIGRTYAEIGVPIDHSLLMAGTFLHDIGKQREFALNASNLVTDYTMEGQMIGHLVIGAIEVAAYAARSGMPAEKSVLLQHILISHHGEPEYGAAVRPVCAEADIVSRVDMLDATMEIYRTETEKTAANTFTANKVFFLGNKRVYRTC